MYIYIYTHVSEFLMYCAMPKKNYNIHIIVRYCAMEKTGKYIFIYRHDCEMFV
jgi:hypothetical protein